MHKHKASIHDRWLVFHSPLGTGHDMDLLDNALTIALEIEFWKRTLTFNSFNSTLTIHTINIISVK